MSAAEFPIRYIEPVFRPPSEAHSLAQQVRQAIAQPERARLRRESQRGL